MMNKKYEWIYGFILYRRNERKFVENVIELDFDIWKR